MPGPWWGYPGGLYRPWGYGWYGYGFDYGPGYPVSDYPDLRVILR